MITHRFASTTLALLLAGAATRHVMADASDTLRADAAKIDTDIQQLQQDQQKVHDLVEPDKKAVEAAAKVLATDSAPLQAQLQADEQALKDLLKADRDAIKAAQDQAHATIHPLETALEQDRKRAKHDKSAAAQVQQEEAQLKAARDKLESDLTPLRDKLKADEKAGKQKLDDERAAMKTTLQPDTQTLNDAQKKLSSDLLWQTKVEADQATLKADQDKLDADKAAAGQ